jgi:hypothetical protein
LPVVPFWIYCSEEMVYLIMLIAQRACRSQIQCNVTGPRVIFWDY